MSIDEEAVNVPAARQLELDVPAAVNGLVHRVSRGSAFFRGAQDQRYLMRVRRPAVERRLVREWSGLKSNAHALGVAR
jgi:hypothetical protein